MTDMVNFFNILFGYDNHYGSVEHFIVGECAYIKTCNGGWSYNESIDRDLHSVFNRHIIVNNHPTTIYQFYLLSSQIKNKELLLSDDVREKFEYKFYAEDEGKKSWEFVKNYLEKNNDKL